MKGWLRALLWLAGFLAVVFGALRYFFLDFHTVPEETNDPRNWANAPNLEPGDFALVWRGATAHAGDMVRCADPSDPNRWLVARVLGLPGDKIDITDGTLRINGFRISTSACQTLPRNITDVDGTTVEVSCALEELGGSKHEVVVRKETLLQGAEAKVQAGKLFLLSDNRSAPWASDSRNAEIGQLPTEACTERLLMRLWSKKGWGDSERRLAFLF
jgi:signal peptidase I